MIFFHQHIPSCTGRRITASFGKDNLPRGATAVESTGEEAICVKCGAYLIVHDPRRHFAQAVSELKESA